MAESNSRRLARFSISPVVHDYDGQRQTSSKFVLSRRTSIQAGWSCEDADDDHRPRRDENGEIYEMNESDETRENRNPAFVLVSVSANQYVNQGIRLRMRGCPLL
ncbi:MAG: hypothetical protein AB1631_04980 [Acidobacteriota bacterium]